MIMCRQRQFLTGRTKLCTLVYSGDFGLSRVARVFIAERGVSCWGNSACLSLTIMRCVETPKCKVSGTG